MSINIGDKPEFQVVNVGEELTSAQLAALQNAQGASATNPCLTRTNTFSTTDSAVRITQTGTGEALRIEDVTNPDASPFVVDADGNVGIGRAASTRKLEVQGNTAITGVITLENSGASPCVTVTQTSGAGAALVVENRGTGDSFIVRDEASDTTPFVISANGNVTLGGSLTLAAGALATSVGSQTYPDELTFIVGGVTYRVPARAI